MVNLLAGVTSLSAIAFSLCDDDVASQVANIVPDSFDIDVRALVDLDKKRWSFARAWSTWNADTKNHTQGI